MSSLARIEIVLFLRDVELFRYCDAEEILRIAAIARERHFGGGETIYQRNDRSDALYCVMQGAVRLRGPAQRPRRVTEKGTFGVLDTLTGRLRTATATAESDTTGLAIEAEDFFDLLSNNIEIVKALFRKLARITPDDAERGMQTWSD